MRYQNILGNVERVPEQEEVLAFAKAEQLFNLSTTDKHNRAKELIAKGELLAAWNYLLL
jgi:hypothetical protein